MNGANGLFIAGALTAAALFGGDAAIATPLDQVRPAVLVVTAHGVSTTLGNVPVESKGTGFYINPQGYVVTSYHLITDLGNVDPTNITFDIRGGPHEPKIVPAIVIAASEKQDWLILNAPVADPRLPVLNPARHPMRAIHVGQTAVYAPGFPEGYEYVLTPGVITSFNPPSGGPPLWLTTFPFKKGQSGSPVVLADGRVIGVAKGVDEDAPTFGFIVPVTLIDPGYWDGTDLPDVPDESGNEPARVVAEMSAPPVTQTRQVALEANNEPCAMPQRHTVKWSATPGWRIEPASVVIRAPINVVADNAAATVEGADTDNIVVGITLSNVGICAEFLGMPLQRDIAASYHGVLEYKEIPINAPLRLVKVAEIVATPGAALSVPVSNAWQLLYSIVRGNGERLYFRPRPTELSVQDNRIVIDVQKILTRVLLNEVSPP